MHVKEKELGPWISCSLIRHTTSGVFEATKMQPGHHRICWPKGDVKALQGDDTAWSARVHDLWHIEFWIVVQGTFQWCPGVDQD